MGKAMLITILLGFIIITLNYFSYYGTYHIENRINDFVDKRCILKYQRKNQKDEMYKSI